MRLDPTRYLLDTNIVLHIVRSNTLVADLEARFALFTGRNRYLISVATLAEVRVLGETYDWGEGKWAELTRLLKSCEVAPITTGDMVDQYVVVDGYNRYMGRDMGSKNDLWIAATALVYDAVLLTTDKDFDHLTQIGVQVERLTA